MKTVCSKHGLARLRVMALALCAVMLLGTIFTSCNDGSQDNATSETDAATQNSTVEVLRISKDVEHGEKLTSAKIETVTVNSSEAWIGALSNPDEVVGKYALKAMSAGEYLLAKNLDTKKPDPIKEKVVLENKHFGFNDYGFVVVTEYLTANTGEDVGRMIQKVIDKNPQSVIYFPDGEYLTSTPIRTPADGAKSVSLLLSDNAVIKANAEWEKGSGAIIRLGGKNERNDITVPGSNYYLEGGIIDGNGVADGVSIDHGRETSVRDVTILNTQVGVHVYKGANGGSSDCDIENIRIYGNGAPTSIGLLIEGWDNTYSNFRIANVQTGVQVESAANLIRDIQCTYIPNPRLTPLYNQSIAFNDLDDRNWYDNCTSTDFSVGFYMESTRSTLTGCVARWTDAQANATQQIAMQSSRTWGCIVRSFAAEFTADAQYCHYIHATEGGPGRVVDPIFDVNAVNQESYEKYKSQLFGEITWNK